MARQRHTTVEQERRAAIERAVDQGIRIRQLTGRDSGFGPWFEAYNPDANSAYTLMSVPGGGYHCDCPSALYRPYCKHLAALDVYFIQHHIDDSAHWRTVVVRLGGREYRLGEDAVRALREDVRGAHGG